jgi:hypothetical protein
MLALRLGHGGVWQGLIVWYLRIEVAEFSLWCLFVLMVLQLWLWVLKAKTSRP